MRLLQTPLSTQAGEAQLSVKFTCNQNCKQKDPGLGQQNCSNSKKDPGLGQQNAKQNMKAQKECKGNKKKEVGGKSHLTAPMLYMVMDLLAVCILPFRAWTAPMLCTTP